MESHVNKIFSRKSYLSVSVLGYNYRLNIQYCKIYEIKIKREETEINISIPIIYKNDADIINYCIQKLYDDVAKKEIESAMEYSRHILGFAPEDYQIKRLNNEYFKCSKKVITINPDIVQFSKEVIYTTIIRAFCKAEYREGSKNYVNALNKGLREYETSKNKNSLLNKRKF